MEVTSSWKKHGQSSGPSTLPASPSMPIHSQILKFKENQTTLYYYDVHRNTTPNFKMLLFFFRFVFSITNVSIHPRHNSFSEKNLVFKRDYYILFYNSVFSPSPQVCKIVWIINNLRYFWTKDGGGRLKIKFNISPNLMEFVLLTFKIWI